MKDTTPVVPLDDEEWKAAGDLSSRLDPAQWLKTASEGGLRCLLIGVYEGQAEKAPAEENIKELERLCDTFGIDGTASLLCPLRKIDPATFLGSGKIEEIHQICQEQNFQAVVFDEEISPAQQRNLETLLHRPVLDRTEVILGVFALRAHSREARLQTELAQAKYQFPRLRRLWTHLGRQSGSGSGGAYLKGEGETQLEIDRRLLRRRIERLEQQLKEVRKQRETQRHARERSGIPTFAIIGYTNAGKSTLLNALTQAGVLAEDKLFATLDTTTRKFALPNHQEILLIDTVGFIRKLPHQLVKAFKSTIEEATKADILLHLVDASHPNALEQAKTTIEVLKELGAEDRPILTILNKIDACTDRIGVERLRMTFARVLRISALTHEGFDELMESMQRMLSGLRDRLVLRIPQADYAVVSLIRQHGHVVSEEYDENDVIVTCDLPKTMRHQVRKYEPAEGSQA